jgi:hypothetical protein
MSVTRTPDRRRVRDLLRARLWQVLAELAGDNAISLTVACHDDLHKARLTIGPAGSLAPPGQPLPPCYFSPIELLVVGAIGPGASLTLKEIVKHSGVKPTTEVRTLVRNLKARGVLTHCPGAPGVRWSDDFHKLRGGSR